MITLLLIFILFIINFYNSSTTPKNLNIIIPTEETIVNIEIKKSMPSRTNFKISNNGGAGQIEVLGSKIINSKKYIILPFIVNYGGSGSFLYIGLFDKEENIHKFSKFIGDRVKIENIKNLNKNSIEIKYLDRTEGTPYSSEPDQLITKTYKILENSFSEE